MIRTESFHDVTVELPMRSGERELWQSFSVMLTKLGAEELSVFMERRSIGKSQLGLGSGQTELGMIFRVFGSREGAQQIKAAVDVQVKKQVIQRSKKREMGLR